MQHTAHATESRDGEVVFACDECGFIRVLHLDRADRDESPFTTISRGDPNALHSGTVTSPGVKLGFRVHVDQ